MASHLSVISWGLPSDPATFSGYTKCLSLALATAGFTIQEYSARDVRFSDALFGAMRLGRGSSGGRIRPEIARSWMWGSRGNAAIRNRLLRKILAARDTGPFLQIGTLVEISRDIGDHFVLTDMTVPQAVREGYFRVARLRGGRLTEALDVQRRALRSAKHIFTLTEWCRESIVADFGVKAGDVTAVYMGSNLEVAERQPTRPHQILFVGIDWERKGGSEMVAGFRLLRERVADAELVIVGCSPSVAAPGVRVLGYLSPRVAENRQRLARLFGESACLCMLSDFEPLGNVFIEAYAAGLPVIAYNRGSRAEIVEDGLSGILCNDRRPETIAEAMERMILDVSFNDGARRRARKLADERFTWRRVSAAIKDQIQRVTEVNRSNQMQMSCRSATTIGTI